MQTAIAVRSTARPVPYTIPSSSPSSRGNGRQDHATSSTVSGGVRLSFARNEEIYAEGEEANCYYKIVSGLVRTYKLTNDGRRQIDAFHFAGDIIGLEPGDEHRISAEAVGDTTVLSYKRSALKSMAGNDGTFAEQLLATMTRRLEQAQDHMVVLGCKNAQEKIATFLLGLAKRLSTSDRVELPMMRADIADHLGLTIETVSRTMAELVRGGVIGLDASHRTIKLHDPAALQLLSA